jgi:hypothetical protein
VAERVFETGVGVGALAWAGLRPAPQTPYNRRVVGPDRRFVWVRGSLAEVKEVRNSLGGTVNDVILTVVTRALRRHLLRREDDVDDLALKVFVPVSIRTDDQRGALGNQVSGLVAPLPVWCDRPHSCLAQITEAMSAIKESGQAVGAQALTELSGFAPPTILSQAARLVTRQRFVNLVVTNIPGPQQPLYLGDNQLLDIFPMVPLGANMGLGVAIVSYHGTINFGLVGDFDAMPDLDVLGDDFEQALIELAAAAGVRHRPAGRREASPQEAPREPVDSGAAAGEPLTGNGQRRLEDRVQRAADRVASAVEAPAPEEPGVERPTAEEPRVEKAAGEPSAEASTPEEPTLVAESADPGVHDGDGAQVTIDQPWPGYDEMRAVEVADRLRAAGPDLISVVRLYEAAHKGRRSVLAATDRALRS